MEIVFNELSLPCSPAADDARGQMKQLCDMLSSVARYGARVLRTTDDFMLRELAPRYTVFDWSVDQTVDRETRRRVKSAASRGPFVEELIGRGESERGPHDVCFQGKTARGLSLAYLLDLAAISMRTKVFSVDPVVVDVSRLSGDSIEETTGEVHHLIDDAALVRNEQWLLNRVAEEVASGRELVERAGELLEGLILCDKAREQLMDLTGSERPFRAAVRHLVELAAQQRRWKSGPFIQGYRYSASSESDATMAKFGYQREFRCPDGVPRTFGWHSKVSVEFWRIHFLAQKVGDPVLIGHVGKHLDIVTA